MSITSCLSTAGMSNAIQKLAFGFKTPNVQFSTSAQGLDVTIETDRLKIRSIRPDPDTYDNYASLFGNAKVMEKYANGQTKTREQIQERIDKIWAKRWKEKDPYSGLAVFHKNGQFIGHVILGHGDAPGEAEIAYLFVPSAWKQHYGSEAVAALVNQYAPATIANGYLLEGKPLTKITATARPDNPASVRILEKLGMHFDKKDEKYGAIRHYYWIHPKISLWSKIGSSLSSLSIFKKLPELNFHR